jgi:hypothetical protein
MDEIFKKKTGKKCALGLRGHETQFSTKFGAT